MNGKLISRRLKVLTDSRGHVFEPLTADMAEAAAWPNLHVATVRPGAVRGNHRHDEGTELIVLFGSDALFVYEEGGVRHELATSLGEAVAVLIPPGVPHAIKNTGEGSLVLLCFQSRAYDADDPDRTPHALLPPGTPE